MNESVLRCHHPEKERTPSDSLTGLGVRDASNDRDSLILQHADNRIGDVHDVEIMRLCQFAPAAAAQVQIPDLLTQHDSVLHNLLEQGLSMVLKTTARQFHLQLHHIRRGHCALQLLKRLQ